MPIDECILADLTQPQYFFDDTLIAQQQRLTRRWLPAAVFPNPLVQPDQPWEGRSLFLYGSILQNMQDGYRMYYSAFQPGARKAMVLLATSTDGFTWEKPALRLIEYEGSRENNIVLKLERALDSPAVIFDAADDAFPYKMLCFQNSPPPPMWQDDWGMYGYQSADGLHWQEIPGKLLAMGDRSSLLKDPRSGRYQCYTRDPEMFAITGGRHISRSESPDFLNWSPPELLLAPDLDDEPAIEFYGMPVFMRHGWYFGMLEYWDSARDIIEVHLALSRDGRQWLRPLPRRPFIAASESWNRAWSTCANSAPLEMGDDLVFYFGGRNVAHGWSTAVQHGVIGYATLTLDRFCALEGSASGQFTTRPIRWPGGNLLINADTRESLTSHPGHCDGELRVEVLDAGAHLLPEWGGDNAAIFHGNTHCRGNVSSGEIRWPGERSLHALRGQTIRLRFHLKHARLFTFHAMKS